MARPLVLIHGYSADGTAFDPLHDALQKKGVNATDINICTYVSLNNEITIKDIAEGLDRAFRNRQVLRDEDQEFDAIVHSTGMLVLRSWLTNYGAAVGANRRLARLKHLIGLAPATWGSPQAHKGRTWLGALVKGNRQLGPDFLNAGDRVLEGLELGSAFTWELAHADLLGKEPYYGTGTATPFVAVFIGNHPYDGLSSVANDPGTDGTVRWAGCGLNARKITIDLTRMPTGADGQPIDRATISPWAANRLDIPMIPVDGRNHSTLIADPDNGMVNLLIDFLRVGEPGGESHDAWLQRARQYGAAALAKMLINPGSGSAGVEGEIKKFVGHVFGESPEELMEGWQQFVVHAIDERGDGISDYMIEVLSQRPDGTWDDFKDMCTDVHAYGPDSSFRCFHVRLPQGISAGKIPLRVRINASTGTELMAYQGYGSEVRQLSATSEPVELDISDLGAGNGSLFFPFTTTLIEIVLNREPLPFNEQSRILQWLTK
jgi:pimeloyl-ACP methyl ester carboxylesterase